MSLRQAASPRLSRYRYLAYLLLAGVTTFHLWYVESGSVDLAPDEAHYWEWSRRLDWSYYSKGPMVAYLMAATTRLGGHSEFFVRLPAVLLALGTAMLLYVLALSLYASERAAFLTLLAVTALPLYAVGSILMTIDAPLGFFWALAAVSIWKALAPSASGSSDERRRRQWWYVLGVSLGLGVLSKYTMLLFVPCLAAYLYVAPGAHPYLRKREPYVALVIGCLLCTPVLVWNGQHEWVSLRHVLGRTGLAQAEMHACAATFLEFLGSQVGVVSPLLFFALLAAIIRALRLGVGHGTDEQILVAMFSGPLLAFFLLWSIWQKVEANWAAPAYLTAVVALGGWWDEQLEKTARRERRRTLAGAVAIVLLPGWLLAGVCHFPSALQSVGIHLRPNLDPTRRLQGWKELGVAVGRHLNGRDSEQLFIMSNHYQIASELAFYVPGQPQVYNINAGRRMNQYDIWGGLDALRGRDALFVTYGDWDAPRPVRDACDALHKLEVVETFHLGQVAQVFSIFRCVRYRGLPAAPGRITY